MYGFGFVIAIERADPSDFSSNRLKKIHQKKIRV